jgi:hypothetical protein
MKQFSDKEIKKYVEYVGDSYTHARLMVPKNILKIMDYFYEINKMVEEAQKRYAS